ncbi:unnamed protein product [Coccothraustes coccothraustes]
MEFQEGKQSAKNKPIRTEPRRTHRAAPSSAEASRAEEANAADKSRVEPIIAECSRTAECHRTEPGSAERSIPAGARGAAGALGGFPACPSLSPSFLLPGFAFSRSLSPISRSPHQSFLSCPYPATPFCSPSRPPLSTLPLLPLPAFPFPSRFPPQPDLPACPFSSPAIAALFPCPLSFFPPRPRGSGCRRIKPRGPEPGAPRPLQQSPHGAGGSRRLPPCRTNPPPDAAGPAAFPTSR